MDSPLPEALLKNLEWIRALARCLLQDGHLAHDVAQEACVAALKSKPTAVRPWLRKVLRREALKLPGARSTMRFGPRLPFRLSSASRRTIHGVPQETA